jgi:probable phosphoglycerate mutase
MNVSNVAPAARAVLVRHGQTAWSRDGRHTSRTDVPLTDEGRAQARALAPRLAAHPFVLVGTSPRARAFDTCRLAGLGDRAERCDDLVEWDYGDYEGRSTADIREEVAGWSVWRDGAPGGESLAQVAARADRIVERVRASSGDCALFSHAHFLRVLAARWLGLPAETGAHLALDAGSISVLGWERETPVITRWNDTGGGL